METIGSITYEWVEPRLVSASPRGKLQADDTQAFFEVVEARIQNEPYFLWEVNVSELDGMTASARRIAADSLVRLPDRAIAVVGGKFAEKILAKLVLTAVTILDSTPRNNQVSFFTDSDSARAWLHDYGANYKPRDK